jgi:hypothetical protein
MKGENYETAHQAGVGHVLALYVCIAVTWYQPRFWSGNHFNPSACFPEWKNRYPAPL